MKWKLMKTEYFKQYQTSTFGGLINLDHKVGSLSDKSESLFTNLWLKVFDTLKNFVHKKSISYNF